MASNNPINMDLMLGAAGQMVLPVQPTFLVHNSGDIINVTGDATVYTCSFDVEDFDHNNNMTATTFTAPVTGKFLLMANISIANAAAGHTVGTCSIVTTSNTFINYLNPYSALGAASKFTYVCSALCAMNAGDTASVVLTISGGAKAITFCGAAELYSTFSGALIC